MFLSSIFRILIIIFFVYCVVNIFKGFLRLNRKAEQKIKNRKRKSPGSGNGKVIELDKDQYKVE